MRFAARSLIVLLIAVFVLAPVAVHAAPVAVAFTEAETEPETEVTSTFPPGMTPAVEAPAASEAERDDPWTARYLAPLLLVGGVVIAVAYFGFYGARVRGRYEVVD